MDYIKIPDWVTSTDLVYSTFIVELISNTKINNNKIDLTELRNIYRSNKDLYFKIVDELSFRGFSCISSKASNLLPNYNFENDSLIIKVDSLTYNYRNIDFLHLGIPTVINRFKIRNDMFFNNIPLDCFFYLNKNIEIDSLISELVKNNFKIFTKLEIENNKKNINFNNTQLNKENLELEADKYNNPIDDSNDHLLDGDLIDRKIIINNISTLQEKNIQNNRIKIEKLNLSRRSYNVMKLNNIHYVEQLKNTTELELHNFRNLGKKSIAKIIEKVSEFYKDIEMYGYNYVIDDNKQDDFDIDVFNYILSFSEEIPF